MKTWSLCRRVAALGALVLAGCVAPPQRWGEWIDPTLGPNSAILRGGRVLVACETFDLSTRAMCQDDLLRTLQGKGVNAIAAPMESMPPNGRASSEWASDARVVGAEAVFVMTLAPATTSAGSGMSVGIGGFSFGGSGGVGVGLSAPIGGGWGNTGFSANGRVMEVRSGRMVWSTTFVASPSSDLGAQFRELTRTVLEAAQNAGLL